MQLRGGRRGESCRIRMPPSPVPDCMFVKSLGLRDMPFRILVCPKNLRTAKLDSITYGRHPEGRGPRRAFNF